MSFQFAFNDLSALSTEIENIVFGLNPGEESRPYRGKSGYYIFKNVEERKAVGKIKSCTNINCSS